MSEAFHEHLNHLSFWEQVDRFFNPYKYSCTATYGNDFIYHVFLVVFFCVVGITILLIVLKKCTKLFDGDYKVE